MKRDICCPEDFGGSHYHCGACGCVSSYQGHLEGQCPPPEERPPYAKEFLARRLGMFTKETKDN